MIQDFVPYQESLLLKKLGFNGVCSGYHSCPVFEYSPVLNPPTEENPDCLNSLYPHGVQYGFTFAGAPTYSQAFAWLDSVHGLSTQDSTLSGLYDLLVQLKARVATKDTALSPLVI